MRPYFRLAQFVPPWALRSHMDAKIAWTVELGRRLVLFRGEILVDPAILHDHHKVPVSIFDEFDVFQRVAIYEYKIREGAVFNHAQLAGIGIDQSGESHQFAIIGSGHLERLRGRVPADQLSKLRTLPAGNSGIEQNVGAKSRLDLVLLG